MNDKPKVYVSRADQINRAWFYLRLLILAWTVLVMCALIATVQIAHLSPEQILRLLTGQVP
jgi:hypothetical protein